MMGTADCRRSAECRQGPRHFTLLCYATVLPDEHWDGIDDSRRLRKRRVLQVPGVRYRDLRRAHTGDGGIKVIERGLGDPGQNLRREAAAAPTFVDDHHAPRPADRCENGVHVERSQRSKINYFRGDAIGRQRIGRR